ncbi:MAG: excalibur calcium-binding domain-containing protein [Sphingomonadaceae bacterium]|nr:excalibur calcium-binding domain-containing protein [Sphingomonadaceae bacterium]
MARDSFFKTAAPLAGLTFLAVYNYPVKTDGQNAEIRATEQSVYYRYCSDAREAGAAPLRKGQPGYAPHLDRDGDGIACEPYIGG